MVVNAVRPPLPGGRGGAFGAHVGRGRGQDEGRGRGQGGGRGGVALEQDWYDDLTLHRNDHYIDHTMMMMVWAESNSPCPNLQAVLIPRSISLGN